ncbi:homocysteine S-methyltransferase family protein [Hirschia baltica]|uniref:Methionine synthase n=1 Tax=Hirschia baltica (strain ATCC 49814 / DSM 5838 / IFAM 1418) TaxID=582402 RepID=C6XMD2_HIRBI|nr:homocysteine S-methyltransferase family protein [Hirschia baltica]ACT58075.1 homocysteine S-methyltransferase [Hirschia baltica ATCC 49814]
MNREQRLEKITKIANERVLILDGAMGTELQTFKLTEEDFRGAQFKDVDRFLKGNNDLLNLTKPDVVKEVHRRYFNAGADIAETNTFSATTIAQADYALESLAAEIAREGAKIAREVADEFETEDAPKAVWSAIGPTNKTLSLSPDVNDPGFREVTFEHVAKAYQEQIAAMAEFSDVFLIETVFDTLNAKAAIKAVKDWEFESGESRPIVLSGTITDASGRTLSGQTTEAFWYSVRHAKPWAIGLNCALGADLMRQYVVALSRVADTRVLAYPNAGLPNEFGEYDVTPDEQAVHLKAWAQDGIVNVLGGCCGTTPAHIEAIAKAVKSSAPRKIPSIDPAMRLSGLEPFVLA